MTLSKNISQFKLLLKLALRNLVLLLLDKYLSACMAAPESELVAHGSKSAATEQQIDPWDVRAARDEQGNALAFDYVAISQYAIEYIP